TFMSAPMALPRSTEVTEAELAGAGAGSGMGAGAGSVVAGVVIAASSWSFLQPASASVPSRAAAIAILSVLWVMECLRDGWGMRRVRRSVGMRDLQHLAGLDQVGVVELVAVGLEDPVPCARLAVELLGDVRQRVAPLHGVGLLADGFLGAARAALDVAEIGLGLRRGRFRAAGAALHVGEIGLLAATAAGGQRQRIRIVGVLGIAHRGLLCRVLDRKSTRLN